jgi:hypothetical protein
MNILLKEEEVLQEELEEVGADHAVDFVRDGARTIRPMQQNLQLHSSSLVVPIRLWIEQADIGLLNHLHFTVGKFRT